MMRALLFCVGLIAMNNSANSEECHARAIAGAASGLNETAAALSIIVYAKDFAVVQSEIADEICNPKRGVAEARQRSAARNAASIFLAEAAKYGQANDVRAIVSEALDGARGLGRVDRRTFGALTMACTASLSGAEIAISAQSVGNCGSRFLMEAGEINISVIANKFAVCTGRAKIRKRDDQVCECSFAGGTLPPSPLPLTCN